MTRVTFDPAKRDATLSGRGLDFADADEVLSGPTVNIVDRRRDYGEQRMVSAGWLRGRLVMLVWTQRDDAVHIISMRKANERERRRFELLFQNR